MARDKTLIDQLGGEARLRAIVDRFVDRMFGDPMIGFFFARADRQRIKDKEFEFAAAHLGAPVVYTGRPLPAAHAAHPIMGGHFMRRLELLKQTLQEFDAPSEVIEHWLTYTEKLRSAVTHDRGSECTDSSIGAPSGALELVRPATAPRRELPLTGVANSVEREPNGEPSGGSDDR